MSVPSVLIIDDDPDFGPDLAALLGGSFSCRFAATGEEGLGAIAFDPPDAVILDLRIEGGRDGLVILDEIRRLSPDLPVVMATDHPSPETEVEALRRGALYYVRKAAGRAEVASKLEKCVAMGRVARERDGLSRELEERSTVYLDSSIAMQRLRAEIDRVAAAPTTTVLIVGESGTGKSLIAREIHRRSPRRRGPFLQVNMAAQREELIDSELFGHLRGSFTGATADRKGHFETARGGTIFLDEVGSLPMSAQGRLLNALEERTILPVGSSVPRRIDARVIAATVADLDDKRRKGEFREDLLGRLSVVTLRVPALRERSEEIPDLVRYYLGRFAAEMGIARIAVSDAAMERLRRHPWRRNNVRELRNQVERALVLHGDCGILGPEAFELATDDDSPEGFDYGSEKERTIARFQRRFFARAFAQVGGSWEHPTAEAIARVGELACIPPQTVRRILRGLRGDTGDVASTGESTDEQPRS